MEAIIIRKSYNLLQNKHKNIWQGMAVSEYC